MITSFRYMNVLVPVLTGALIFAALTFGWSSMVKARPGHEIVPSITVEGVYKSTAKPDIATFTVTIQEEAAEQSVAQARVAEREKAILDYLREQGVEDKDLKSGNYDLAPQYEYQVDTNCNINYCPGKQVQTGYQVTQTITVKVRELDTAGELIAGVGARGAENISQLTFTIDDLAQLKEDALAAAIENAHEKAEARADALDVRLGRVMSFYEVSNPMLPYRDMYSVSAKAEGAPTPELPAGETEYTITVSVQYAIR